MDNAGAIRDLVSERMKKARGAGLGDPEDALPPDGGPLALDLAAQYNVPMAVGAAVGNELSEALARGWGDLDFDATVRVQEERTGVVLQLAAKSP